MEPDQKLIRPGELHDGLVQQIWAQTDQRFVCKYAETVRQIRDQKMAGIQVNQAGGAQNDLAHQIWAQFDQQFHCKCA